MPRPRLSDAVRGKALTYLGAGLALAGAGTATAAAGLSATALGVTRLDGGAPAAPAPPVPQIHAVGLDHMGGDLKRSVRVTRRSSGSSASQRQSWAGVALIVPKQMSPVSALAA